MYTPCVKKARRNEKGPLRGLSNQPKLLILLTFYQLDPLEPQAAKGSDQPNEYRSRAL
jgi:hypothetical protein